MEKERWLNAESNTIVQLQKRVEDLEVGLSELRARVGHLEEPKKLAWEDLET